MKPLLAVAGFMFALSAMPAVWVRAQGTPAPARSIAFMSSTVRMPPPTVSGIKHLSAVRSTTSIIVARPSEEAVMSRKTSSSAPWLL